MREAMLDRRGERRASCARSGGSADAASRFAASPCPAPRSCRRASRAAAGGAAGSRRRRAARRRRCRSASGAASSAAFTGSSSWRPSLPRNARIGPGTERAGGLPRRADRRAEIHQRLGEFAGALARDERLQRRADQRLRRRQRQCRWRRGGRSTRSTLPSIDGDRLVEGDRRDRRGGVGADAREGARARQRFRESARRAARRRRARRRSGCGRASSSRAPPRRP